MKYIMCLGMLGIALASNIQAIPTHKEFLKRFQSDPNQLKNSIKRDEIPQIHYMIGKHIPRTTKLLEKVKYSSGTSWGPWYKKQLWGLGHLCSNGLALLWFAPQCKQLWEYGIEEKSYTSLAYSALGAVFVVGWMYGAADSAYKIYRNRRSGYQARIQAKNAAWLSARTWMKTEVVPAKKTKKVD